MLSADDTRRQRVNRFIQLTIGNFSLFQNYGFNLKNLQLDHFLCAFLLSVDFLKLTFSKQSVRNMDSYFVEPDLGLTVC